MVWVAGGCQISGTQDETYGGIGLAAALRLRISGRRAPFAMSLVALNL